MQWGMCDVTMSAATAANNAYDARPGTYPRSFTDLTGSSAPAPQHLTNRVSNADAASFRPGRRHRQVSASKCQ